MANIVKLFFNSEIRRLSLPSDELSYENVKKLTYTLFSGLAQREFHFKYTDDEGDVITVSSEREFEEAVRISTAASRPLRFVVVELKPRQPSFAPGSNRAEEEVIHPASCDHCQKFSHERIRGIRYKCLGCPDYDLCGACFEKERSQPGSIHLREHLHQFRPIQRPFFQRSFGCPFQRPPHCFFQRPTGCGEARRFPLFNRVICDGCSKDEPTIIQGIRFKCTSCPDYDLCQECYRKETANPGSVHQQNHTDHFLRLISPFGFGWFPHQEEEEDSDDEEEEPSVHGQAKEDARQKEESEVKKPTVSIPIVVSEPEPAKENPIPLKPAHENTPSAPRNESIAAARELSEFEGKLRQLEEMGFSNREQNISALVKAKGNLVDAVKDILSID